MMMSEYMSIKTLQYHEAQFRRELERRRIIYERLAEQSERRHSHPAEANRVAAAGPHTGHHRLARRAVRARGGVRSASAQR